MTLKGNGSEFVCDNQKIYFLTKISTKKKGKLVYVWFRNGKEVSRKETGTKPPQWTGYSYIILKHGHAGDWRVEVRYKDEILKA